MAVAFIGIGNMGSALAKGYLAKNPGSATQVRVQDVDSDRARSFCATTGCMPCEDAATAVKDARLVLLAVKPQVLPDALSVLAPLFTSGTVLVSIAAGVTLARLRELAGPAPAIARAMPNTPAMVGAGATAVAFDGASKEDEAVVLAFFEGVGLAIRVEEKMMDAVTGLSGSGPAYVMLFLESLSDAGVKLGLPRDVSLKLAAAMVEGSARMVLETGMHPAVLKDMVCSPGGTTIEAVRTLERNGFRSATIEAVCASAQRSAEMAAKSGEKHA